MLTLERYEELHRRYPWLVWFPVADRRTFAEMLEAASSEEDRRRLAAWWQNAVQWSLAARSTDVSIPHVPNAA